MKCQRHILLPNVHNLRDLGGYPAADGKTTKWNILYRTDSLTELTEDGWKGLEKLEVTCVIDLRSAREREQSPVEPGYDLKYLGFSLMGDSKNGPAHTLQLTSEDGGIADSEFLKSTRLDYTSTLFTNIGCAGDILSAILSELNAGGRTAFMCSAGKDRTGMVAAMLLYLCGVPDEDIIADYMVSNIYNTDGINKRIPEMMKSIMKREADPAFIKANMSSSPETMKALLSSFKERDLKKTLAENGFSEEKQERLASLITE